MKSLSDSLDKIALERGKDMLRTAQLSLVSMVDSVVDRTPIDSGDLRGSWQSSVGAAERGDIDRSDREGSATKNLALKQIEKLDGTNVFYFVNNKPYAGVAEYGGWGTGPYATTKTTRDGYSVQAPYGMVRITVSEFQSKFDDALREIRSQQKPIRE